MLKIIIMNSFLLLISAIAAIVVIAATIWFVNKRPKPDSESAQDKEEKYKDIL